MQSEIQQKYITFEHENEIFAMEHPDNYTYLYFPIAGEQGIKSSVTPNFSGDSKLDQNTFLLEPVSSENLHNNKSSRNFWCCVLLPFYRIILQSFSIENQIHYKNIIIMTKK